MDNTLEVFKRQLKVDKVLSVKEATGNNIKKKKKQKLIKRNAISKRIYTYSVDIQKIHNNKD
ncbi:hypothetical protein FACS189472_09920 [Alphaproteobacteria bacterium]|nr:hypothetical protein FACS189472_09920 [Alphaproteobacteria bacterium]